MVLAEYERHTDTVQWLSLIAREPKQPLALRGGWGGVGGRAAGDVDGGRPTLRILFFLFFFTKSYARLDWLLWAWGSGFIALWCV